ncbi:MAG: DotU family type IV/VI secretion system protein [Chitinispirillia bacterium]|nr:DotU family type IV/VI secretion system protein [Chitinispirillia bacterium]MCL2267645.1 DotU family type IV/VI secretion system protein [Chitinispirillia bacterium]
MKSANYADYHQMRNDCFCPRAVTQTCAEIVAVIIDASKPSSTCNPAELHESLCARFDAVIKRCKVSSLPDNAAPDLLYPLAALADETFLSIPQYRYYWSERPLQLRYFGEAEAGTKFFSRLEAHINVKPPRREVLELYFTALALGLKGMYGVDGGDQRRRLKTFEDLGVMLRSTRKRDGGEAVSVDRKESFVSKVMMPLIYVVPVLLIIVAAAVAWLTSRADLLKFLDNF